ncbi:MAG: AMP-binding protein [Clostridia bacterium]
MDKMNTLKDLLTNSCEKYKNKVAFLEKDHETQTFSEITYSTFKEDVISLGTALLQRGFKGEKIVVIGENSYKWFTTYMAVTCGVGIIVPMDKELPSNEIVNLVNRSKAKVIVYSSKIKEKVLKLKNQMNIVTTFIEMDSQKTDENSISYNDLLKEGSAVVNSGDNSYMNIQINKRDFTILLFTSGTTADAKGVMLCHENIATNVGAAQDILKLSSNDRFLSVLPIHHTYELTGTYIFPLWFGASIAICEGLKYIAKDMELAAPTAIMVVPLILEKLERKIKKALKDQGKTELIAKMVKLTDMLKKAHINVKRLLFKPIYSKVGGKLKYLFSGAAPIDKSLAQYFEDLGFCFLQGYGLTETAPLITGIKSRKIGSVGKSIRDCKTIISNPNEDGIGEVVTKGPNVMLGYYENEEETNKVLIDGWFHTGDLGYFDKDDDLFITGRLKNVIVTKNGKNIFPEEIETLINKIPLVLESLVYGLESKDDKTDVNVAAIVTLDEEYIEETYGKTKPTKEEIYDIIFGEIKKINSQLVSYKAVRDLKIKDEDFVKTTTMKIKRFIEIEKQNNV